MSINFGAHQSLDTTELRESVSECVGWRGLIDTLLADLDVLLAQAGIKMRLLQIKEKLGELRVYHRLEGAEEGTVERVRELVRAAEKASATTCIRCGAPANVQNMSGWLAPMCEEHAREPEFRFGVA